MQWEEAKGRYGCVKGLNESRNNLLEDFQKLKPDFHPKPVVV